MEKLGINLGFLLFQILNFGVLAVLLYAFAYRPILKMLETRKQTVAKGVEDARIAGEARANAEKEAEKIKADAQSEAARIVREATERAEQVGREIRAAAELEANQARDGALAEIQVERDRILGDVRSQVVTLSLAATQKLIGETLDDKRQHILIDDFFSGIKSGKVTVLDDKVMTGGSAEVTSALPLTDSEKTTVKEDILAKLGSQATVTFRVNPAILGGLVVRVGGKVLDGSVAGQMENLRGNLS